MSTSTSPPPAMPLRNELRAGTRELHDDLERRLPVSRDAVDLDVYRDHLAFLFGFHAPLERRLAKLPNLTHQLPDLERRFKADALRADLGRIELPEAGNGDLPDCRSCARALGVLYVLEGAGRGAKILLGRLRRDGVLPGPVGSSYLEGYGADAGAMWQTLCDALDDLPEAQRDAARHAAEDTFSALIRWWESWTRR